ncbi:MAG TPA: hypothetical protein VII44_11910, partial [Puia sp.]
MKPLTVCLVFSVLILQNVKSQDKATFSLFHGQTIRANLMAIKDSSVFIYKGGPSGPDPFHKKKVNMYLSSNWDQYHYNFIESIKIENKNLRSLTIIPGAIAGLIGGALIGKSSGKGVNSFAGVILGGILGAGVGAI